MPRPIYKFVDNQHVVDSDGKNFIVVRERPDGNGNIVVKDSNDNLFELSETLLEPAPVVVIDHWTAISYDGIPRSYVCQSEEMAYRDAKRYDCPFILAITDGVSINCYLNPLYQGDSLDLPEIVEFWRAIDHEGVPKDQVWLTERAAQDESIRFHYTSVLHVVNGIVAIETLPDGEEGRYSDAELADRERLFAEFDAWDEQVAILAEHEEMISIEDEMTRINAQVQSVRDAEELMASMEEEERRIAAGGEPRDIRFDQPHLPPLKLAANPVDTQVLRDKLEKKGHKDKLPPAPPRKQVLKPGETLLPPSVIKPPRPPK